MMHTLMIRSVLMFVIKELTHPVSRGKISNLIIDATVQGFHLSSRKALSSSSHVVVVVIGDDVHEK